ncbi:hypothetical protein RIR_jg6159.t1 [Rhizophagus irregularis DAOM 181602=DAOM 197198]|nr:hypothetical protein RIR_jg6159.t1 [Rhizophagus irregularis DAOM 181602=DAOM 197198]
MWLKLSVSVTLAYNTEYLQSQQPAAATHQSTSIQNLTFDLGQLNLSGGSSDANTSFSNLVLDILKTTKENSEIIRETAKRNYETNRKLWFVVKDTHDVGYLNGLMPDLVFRRKMLQIMLALFEDDHTMIHLRHIPTPKNTRCSSDIRMYKIIRIRLEEFLAFLAREFYLVSHCATFYCNSYPTSLQELQESLATQVWNAE